MLLDEEGDYLLPVYPPPLRLDSLLGGWLEEDIPYRVVIDRRDGFLQLRYLLETLVLPYELQCSDWTYSLKSVGVEIGPEEDGEVHQLLTIQPELAKSVREDYPLGLDVDEDSLARELSPSGDCYVPD